ncbi:MAG: 50S ribosomal protein L31 [Lentisphaeria bacterium]|jgi:large subunit ribosomal protein L31
MKKDIHPTYVDCKVVCACGSTFQVQSVKKEIHVGICSKCHPFYSGKQKLMDTEGRVDRFRRKYEGVKVAVAAKPAGKKG